MSATLTDATIDFVNGTVNGTVALTVEGQTQTFRVSYGFTQIVSSAGAPAVSALETAFGAVATLAADSVGMPVNIATQAVAAS